MRIAITTFRRPVRLAALLTRVDHLLLHCDPRSTDVLVVDNDPDSSARAVVARHRGRLAVRIVHEPEPGIAAARSRALIESTDVDLLACLDDDVTPSAGWLDALVGTWRDSGAAVVMGHVCYIWPDDADPWLIAGGFWRRAEHSTGTELGTVATGNVLLDTAQLRALGVDFDRSLGLAGGEDTVFGHDVLRAGGRIVACADAVVIDELPAVRAQVPFVRRRIIAQGKDNQTVRHRRLGGAMASLRARAVGLAAGGLRVVRYGAAGALALMRGERAAHAAATRERWYGQGLLLGALGARGTEYARPPDHARRICRHVPHARRTS